MKYDVNLINDHDHQAEIAEIVYFQCIGAMKYDLIEENLEKIDDAFSTIKLLVEPFVQTISRKKYTKTLMLFYRLSEFAGYIKFLYNATMEKPKFKYIMTKRLSTMCDVMDYPNFDWLKLEIKNLELLGKLNKKHLKLLNCI